MLDKVAILTNRNTSTWKKPNVQFIFHKGLKTLGETWLPSFFFEIQFLQIYTNDGCKDIKIKIYVYQPFSWDHKTHIYEHIAHASSVVKIYCPKKYQIERFLLPALIFQFFVRSRPVHWSIRFNTSIIYTNEHKKQAMITRTTFCQWCWSFIQFHWHTTYNYIVFWWII